MNTLEKDKVQFDPPVQPSGEIDRLNLLLADLHLHQQILKSFHWNVSGMQFYGLHQLFEMQYTKVSELIDELAEHVKIRGYYPVSRLADMLKFAQIKEPLPVLKARGMIKYLIENIRILEAEIMDAVENDKHDLNIITEDLLTSQLRVLKKHQYLLEGHLR